MAKYETTFKGDFDHFTEIIHKSILKGSLSISLEDSSHISTGNVRLTVLVYERYSAIGSNRVSLNLSILGHEEKIFVSAITSGGSQAVLFKINTFGEEAFLENCIHSIEAYVSEYGQSKNK